MALEDILQRIRSDSDAACQRILQTAQERADTIREEAEKRSNDNREEILKQAEAKARERRERISTVGALERRKDLLEAKQEGIRAALMLALSSFKEMPTGDYRALLKGMLVSVASGTERVIVSPEDHESLDETFFREVNDDLKKTGKPGQLTLSEETRPMSGGAILSQGQVEINLSFDMTLSLIGDDLEPEIARILYSNDK
jgi:V/A-type H+-transporting ATPase subunit E